MNNEYYIKFSDYKKLNTKLVFVASSLISASLN